MTKNYTNIILNALPDREMEITGEISAEKMSLLREKAIKKLKETVTVDGFRQGNAPDSMIVQKVGDMRILEEAAEIALSEEYPNILDEHKIDAIGRPDIAITKIAIGSPLGFKVRTSLAPEVKLGEYKTITAKENSRPRATAEVTDAEVDNVIQTVRKNIAHQKLHEAHGLDAHSHDHGEIQDKDLPEIDDAFVKTLGDFTDLADFKQKIKADIAKEKELKERDRRRTAILEAIIAESVIDLPKIIVEGEMEKMLAQLKDDLAKSGISYEDYLKHIKKTEEDIRSEWRDTAVKRAKSQIILNTIARDENIAPPEEEIKKEMEHILSHYADADRFRVRMYVETFMTNELVFQFLEKQG